MKKVIFLAFFMLFFSLDNFAQKASIDISIKIASLKRNCNGGFGFRCGGDVTITVDLKRKPNSLPRESVISLSSTNPNSLVVKIDKNNGIASDLYVELFKGKDSILMDDEWEVPSEYLKKINYSGNFVIKSGNYAVKEDGNFVYITFTK